MGAFLNISSNITSLLKKTIRASKLIFTPLAFVFLCYFAWHSRQQLTLLINNANLTFFITSFCLWMFLHLLSPIFTLAIFNGWGKKKIYSRLLFIHVSRLPAKYIPGGIWHSVARWSAYKELGLNSKNILAYFFLENTLVALIALTLGAFLILFNLEIFTTIHFILSFIWLTGAVIIILIPIAVRYIKIFNQYSVSLGYYYFAALSMLLNLLFASLSFLFFLEAFSELEIASEVLNTAGVYIFSWGVGFLAIFAPQGIGVSEYVAANLLTSNMSTFQFIALLSSFRILVLFADLFTWLIAKSFCSIIPKFKEKN
jgi:hypothetical protein